MNPSTLMSRLRRLVLALVLAVPLAALAADQKTFATPEAAVDALLAALKANDEAALFALFGEKFKNVVTTGDPARETETRARAAQQLQTYRFLSERGADRSVLLMGEQAWPMPIPLVREAGAWRFATEIGAEEIINRRVGANENNAILVLRAYVDAQRQFASRDRMGDGVLQYARRIASAPGKKDGLYWPADLAKGEEPSPFGPLLAENDIDLKTRKQGDPYQGYHFRILTRQGQHAPGGAYSYVINGRMLAGFAMVAYPHAYGDSGVMTFIVSHNGKVYERDLGPKTETVASQMTTFDPGPGWKVVTP
ncbi:MAG: DUF2950 domain-containing protein [Burkholderiaceae bacterium]|nr:DUF2950 domain-containing protein [Burkholderiaceae bacterium]